MIETLKTLCALSGVSSFEDEVRDYIKGRVAPHADDVRVDAMGNLIVFKKGVKSTGNKLMLCAHMDEVGLIVTYLEEDGLLRFSPVGGIDRDAAQHPSGIAAPGDQLLPLEDAEIAGDQPVEPQPHGRIAHPILGSDLLERPRREDEPLDEHRVLLLQPRHPAGYRFNRHPDHRPFILLSITLIK